MTTQPGRLSGRSTRRQRVSGSPTSASRPVNTGSSSCATSASDGASRGDDPAPQAPDVTAVPSARRRTRRTRPGTRTGSVRRWPNGVRDRPAGPTIWSATRARRGAYAGELCARRRRRPRPGAVPGSPPGARRRSRSSVPGRRGSASRRRASTPPAPERVVADPKAGTGPVWDPRASGTRNESATRVHATPHEGRTPVA